MSWILQLRTSRFPVPYPRPHQSCGASAQEPKAGHFLYGRSFEFFVSKDGKPVVFVPLRNSLVNAGTLSLSAARTGPSHLGSP
jgi:hypothetical protein